MSESRIYGADRKKIMNDSVFQPASLLSEQVARHIFEILPESGIVMIILDKDGNCWPSNSDEFSKLRIDQSCLKQLCQRIDDAQEPVISQLDQCSIVSAQLATSKTNCGYIIVALPHYSPESTLTNLEMIEILLNQVNLIAKLIEKNNMLYELLLRHHVSTADSPAAAGSLN
jgi:hypothetical protein